MNKAIVFLLSLAATNIMVAGWVAYPSINLGVALFVFGLALDLMIRRNND